MFSQEKGSLNRKRAANRLEKCQKAHCSRKIDNTAFVRFEINIDGDLKETKNSILLYQKVYLK